MTHFWEFGIGENGAPLVRSRGGSNRLLYSVGRVLFARHNTMPSSPTPTSFTYLLIWCTAYHVFRFKCNLIYFSCIIAKLLLKWVI